MAETLSHMMDQLEHHSSHIEVRIPLFHRHFAAPGVALFGSIWLHFGPHHNAISREFLSHRLLVVYQEGGGAGRASAAYFILNGRF